MKGDFCTPFPPGGNGDGSIVAAAIVFLMFLNRCKVDDRAIVKYSLSIMWEKWLHLVDKLLVKD